MDGGYGRRITFHSIEKRHLWMWKNELNKIAYGHYSNKQWFYTFYQLHKSNVYNTQYLVVSEGERGTIENSELRRSERGKYPCGGGLGLWLGNELIDKADVVPEVNLWFENGGTVVFGLPCEPSVGLPVLLFPPDSLFSLSSVSLSRKSTHISANDWKKGKSS